MLRIAFVTGDRTHAQRSVTRSRDAQGLGLTADAARYLRTLLRRPLGALARQLYPRSTFDRINNFLEQDFIGTKNS